MPLDASHVFTNLSEDGVLTDGAYIADAGNIDITGSNLDPISTLSAVVYINGKLNSSNEIIDGDLSVNGESLDSSLTLITPSANGEGDLILRESSGAFGDFANPIEIQGLTGAEPKSFTLEDGTTLQGGGLYLDNGELAGPGLTIDAADPADPGSLPAFISGSGNVNPTVTMNGIVFAKPTANLAFLDFVHHVTGSGEYIISADPDTGQSEVLQFDESLLDSGGGNSIIFDDQGLDAQLRLGMLDVTHDFQATIRNFGPNDQIILTNVHATAATFNSFTKLLSVLDAKGNVVATLQLDSTIPSNQTFTVASNAFVAGGSTIEWSNPHLAPAITGNFTGSVSEDAATPVESLQSNLQFRDTDGNASYLYSLQIEGDPPLGSLRIDNGPLVLNNGVTASGGNNPLGLAYKVADSALDFLQGGETKTDTFYLELSDLRFGFINNAGFTHSYTVTLQGRNDAPIIGNVDLPTAALTGFSLAGDANVAAMAAHPDDFVGNNIYNLLAPSMSQPGQPSPQSAGAIWHPIDISDDFTVHARLFFGSGVFPQFDSGAADGITFALQNTGAGAVGGAGNGLGIDSGTSGGPSPIPNAVGITFNTSGNPADFTPDQNSSAYFFANGDPQTPIAANPTQQDIGNVDDGSWHDLVVTWNATTHQLTYKLDGVMTYTGNTRGAVQLSASAHDGSVGSSNTSATIDVISHFHVIKGATVFADANGNGQLDAGEASAITDTGGGFALTGGSGPLVAFGGTDSSTGLPFRGELAAPADSIVITPLTTLLTDLASDQSAEPKILAALGLSPSLDLEALDPIASAKAGDLAGGAAEVAAAKVYDTVSLIASTIAGAGSAFGAAMQNSFAALAAAIESSSLDLTSTTALAALVNGIAQIEHVTLPAGAAADIASVIAAGNAALNQVLGTDQTGDALLADTAAIELVMQGVASRAFANAGGNAAALPGITSLFTGADLTALIGQARNQVQNLGQDLGPVAFSGSATTDEDTVLAGSVAAVDLTGNPISYALDGIAPAGLTFRLDGTLSFDPRTAFNYLAVGESATVSFQFTATDGHVGSNLAMETITIVGRNDPPSAAPDSNGVAKGTTVSVAAGKGVLANDSDPDTHDHLVVGAVNGSAANVGHAVAGTYGSLTLNADGSYAYAANKGSLPSQIVAQDVFSYTVADGHGGASTSTLSIVVTDPSMAYLSGKGTTLNGGSGKNVLDGSAGRDMVIGGNGADVLIGGDGDTLTGGNGPDTFLFRPSFGTNTITDFNVNNDVIQFDKSIFQMVSAIAAHTSDSAAGAIIGDGHGDSITLTGVTAAQLATHPGDFHLA